MRSTRVHLAGLFVVAASVPLALGLETLIRWAIMPSELEYLRAEWGSNLTPVVWYLVVVAVVADVGAFILRIHLQRRAARPGVCTPGKKPWKELEGLLIAASVAQMPGMVAALLHMLGAALSPTCIAIAIGTVGVLVLGVTLDRQSASVA
jgi:hypothetical protein